MSGRDALAALASSLPSDGARLADESALIAFAATLQVALSSALASGPVRVSLVGELGAGKTALVRALLGHLGHRGPVRSPTYTLFESYAAGGWHIAHADLYRLVDPQELEHTGFDDLVAGHDLLLVEWAARGGDRMPPFDLLVHLDYAADDGRIVRLEFP